LLSQTSHDSIILNFVATVSNDHNKDYITFYQRKNR